MYGGEKDIKSLWRTGLTGWLDVNWEIKAVVVQKVGSLCAELTVMIQVIIPSNFQSCHTK